MKFAKRWVFLTHSVRKPKLSLVPRKSTAVLRFPTQSSTVQGKKFPLALRSWFYMAKNQRWWSTRAGFAQVFSSHGVSIIRTFSWIVGKKFTLGVWKVYVFQRTLSNNFWWLRQVFQAKLRNLHMGKVLRSLKSIVETAFALRVSAALGNLELLRAFIWGLEFIRADLMTTWDNLFLPRTGSERNTVFTQERLRSWDRRAMNISRWSTHPRFTRVLMTTESQLRNQSTYSRCLHPASVSAPPFS